MLGWGLLGIELGHGGRKGSRRREWLDWRERERREESIVFLVWVFQLDGLFFVLGSGGVRLELFLRSHNTYHILIYQNERFWPTNLVVYLYRY